MDSHSSPSKSKTTSNLSSYSPRKQMLLRSSTKLDVHSTSPQSKSRNSSPTVSPRKKAVLRQDTLLDLSNLQNLASRILSKSPKKEQSPKKPVKRSRSINEEKENWFKNLLNVETQIDLSAWIPSKTTPLSSTQELSNEQPKTLSPRRGRGSLSPCSSPTCDRKPKSDFLEVPSHLDWQLGQQKDNNNRRDSVPLTNFHLLHAMSSSIDSPTNSPRAKHRKLLNRVGTSLLRQNTLLDFHNQQASISSSSSFSSASEDIVGKLISLNPAHPDIYISKNEVTLGRGRTCSIRFPKASCKQVSSIHCSISVDSSDSTRSPVISITDSSLNGTFVNGEKIGKGNKRVLEDSDTISLVNDYLSISDRADTIAYRFIRVFRITLTKSADNEDGLSSTSTTPTVSPAASPRFSRTMSIVSSSNKNKT